MAATTPSTKSAERLREIVHVIIRMFLVSGRAGPPAEGHLPFNPLYFHILGRLRERGPTRPSELAAKFGVARTTLSTAVNALVNRGLLQKERDPHDGRAQLVKLSDTGLMVAKAIYRQDLTNMKVLLEQLDHSEIEPLLELLEKVVRGLESASSGDRDSG